MSSTLTYFFWYKREIFKLVASLNRSSLWDKGEIFKLLAILNRSPLWWSNIWWSIMINISVNNTPLFRFISKFSPFSSHKPLPNKNPTCTFVTINDISLLHVFHQRIFFHPQEKSIYTFTLNSWKLCYRERQNRCFESFPEIAGLHY